MLSSFLGPENISLGQAHTIDGNNTKQTERRVSERVREREKARIFIGLIGLFIDLRRFYHSLNLT